MEDFYERMLDNLIKDDPYMEDFCEMLLDRLIKSDP